MSGSNRAVRTAVKAATWALEVATVLAVANVLIVAFVVTAFGFEHRAPAARDALPVGVVWLAILSAGVLAIRGAHRLGRRARR